MKATYKNLLEEIPSYSEFLTVEEMRQNSIKLAAEYPDVVSHMVIGQSRNGESVDCLKIGNGSHVGLMFGCPHPNEPIGAMMLEYFSEAMAKDAQLREDMDYTWYIIKCWDVDGTKLNENWFKGPYTIHNYARNFFRPAGNQQVDWTFPIDYKNLHFHDTIPEAQAMMDLIDEIEPEFIYSLHNAGFGGVYWYITHELDAIYDTMRDIAIKQDVPLNLGEPEAPYCLALSPAIYQNLGIQENYDYLEKYGVEHPEESIKVGTCSADFAKEKFDSFTLLTELPYFYDPRIKDLSESDITRKDAVLESLAYSEEANDYIVSVMGALSEHVKAENPFMLALVAFTRIKDNNEATRKMVEEDPDFAKMATVAEAFDSDLVSKFYKTLSYGLLIRMAETTLEEGAEGVISQEGISLLKEKMEEAESRLKDLTEHLEEEMNYSIVPIKKLIHIQLESGLEVMEFLKNKDQATE